MQYCLLSAMNGVILDVQDLKGEVGYWVHNFQCWSCRKGINCVVD